MGSHDSATSSDEDVARQVLAGDVDAYEALVAKYEEHVMRVVSRHVPHSAAAEVAHESFVRAYLALDRFRDSGSFERWITRIALRTCSDHWRGHFRESDRRETVADPGLEARPAVAAVDRSDERELLDRALARLGTEDRRVLTLVYFEGLSVRECAEVLDWTATRVKVRAHRARRKLRDWLLAETRPTRQDGSR